jgi:hypothetical protein
VEVPLDGREKVCKTHSQEKCGGWPWKGKFVGSNQEEVNHFHFFIENERKTTYSSLLIQWYFCKQVSPTFLLAHTYLYPSTPAPTSRSTSLQYAHHPEDGGSKVIQNVGILPQHAWCHNPEDLDLNVNGSL